MLFISKPKEQITDIINQCQKVVNRPEPDSLVEYKGKLFWVVKNRIAKVNDKAIYITKLVREGLTPFYVKTAQVVSR